jgi:NAD-dependent SIR2 family protein deacetylase
VDAERSWEELSEDDIARLSAQRKWVLDHYDDPKRAESVEGKLRLLSFIIGENWIEPHETVKLQCLGVVFGDALAQRLSLSWKIVIDSVGRDPALVVAGTSLRIFPLTMISKRIEKGEQVDVVDMFGGICAHVNALSRELK